MSTHTQGPWFFGRMLDPRDAPCVIGDGDSVVAILPGDWNGCTFIREDAQLMSAAPDMLAALRRLVHWYGSRIGFEDELLPAEEQVEWIGDAMRAIAKATGEQP